jgi:starch-binding outer membrane protein, SusD/RagB family
MKYINTVFLMFTLIFSLNSCKSDFLELAPLSEVSTINFYKTPDDIKAAVNAVYSTNQSTDMYFGNLVYLLENRSDNAVDLNSGGNAGREYALDYFTESSDNFNLQSTWSTLYAGIFKTNIVLEKIESVTIDAKVKERYKAEVRFLRALNYFHLVRMWGKVPVLLTAISPLETYNLKRDEVATVYKAIEDDLIFAGANLPATYTNTELGRATSGAANALLGKVYLNQKKYTEAKTILGKVISDGTFKLQKKIADVFDVNNEYNSEIVFAVRYSKTIANEGHLLNFTHNVQYLGLDPALLKAYESTDTRRDMLNTTTINSSLAPVKKFYDTPFNGTLYGNDFPVIRYADVLLMYAETLNEIGYSASGDAFANLNAIRERAGAKLYSPQTLTNQSTFREAIYDERRLEFPLEEQRWYDLLRTGRAAEAINKLGGDYAKNFKEFRLLYAIPKSEIDKMNNAANFPQNPGY